MREGYTKRWRKRWDKGYHKDLLLWVLMDYFIDHANYEDGEKFIPGSGIIKLRRGDCLFGTISLSKFFNVGRQQIRSRLELLKKADFLTIQPTNKYSIATILNYDKYNPRQPAVQPTEQPIPNQHPTSTQPHRMKVNKEKESKEVSTLAQNNGFGKFWAAHPKKKSKGDALKAWNQLKKNKQLPPIQIILASLGRLKVSHDWTKQGGRFIPYPATWLRAMGWEDDINTDVPQGISETEMHNVAAFKQAFGEEVFND